MRYPNLNLRYHSAIIIEHCAVAGRIETPIRAYCVEPPAPYAQHPVAVAVVFIRARKRRANVRYTVPDNLRYMTIEEGGNVVYDSRTDVPCDMDSWHHAKARHADRLQRSAYVHQ